MIDVAALSRHQQEVVAKLRETGKPLVRWPGGFWTYEGCPRKAINAVPVDYEVPEWHTGTGTMRALERLGVLIRNECEGEEWNFSRVLAEAFAPVPNTYGIDPKVFAKRMKELQGNSSRPMEIEDQFVPRKPLTRQEWLERGAHLLQSEVLSGYSNYAGRQRRHWYLFEPTEEKK